MRLMPSVHWQLVIELALKVRHTFTGRQVRSKTVPVPLTPGSRLVWLGKTDVGSPCTYDNTGVLRLYDVATGVWMPICDTNNHSRGASDSWYIVSVSTKIKNRIFVYNKY